MLRFSLRWLDPRIHIFSRWKHNEVDGIPVCFFSQINWCHVYMNITVNTRVRHPDKIIVESFQFMYRQGDSKSFVTIFRPLHDSWRMLCSKKIGIRNLNNLNPVDRVFKKQRWAWPIQFNEILGLWASKLILWVLMDCYLVFLQTYSI